jgi:hypothetical protein
MPQYSHAFTLFFEVNGSTTEDGDELTDEQLRDAIYNRVPHLMAAGQLAIVIGAPFDTHIDSPY